MFNLNARECYSNLTRKRSNFSSRIFISAAAFFLMSDNFFLASASSFARCFSVILKISINKTFKGHSWNLLCQVFSMIFILFELTFSLLKFSFQFLNQIQCPFIRSSSNNLHVCQVQVVADYQPDFYSFCQFFSVLFDVLQFQIPSDPILVLEFSVFEWLRKGFQINAELASQSESEYQFGNPPWPWFSSYSVNCSLKIICKWHKNKILKFQLTERLL